MEQKRFESAPVKKIETGTEVLIGAIEDINQEVLQSVFSERLARYGITEAREILAKERIHFDLPQEKKNIAEYHRATKSFHFSPFWVKERFVGVDQRIAACMVACHEQTHYVSHHDCSIVSETDDEVVVREQVGMNEIFKLGKKEMGTNNLAIVGSGQQFTFLNEGVTEMFAREVLGEYLQRDPEFASPDKQQEFFDTLPKLELAYNPIVTVVEQLIKSVAKRTMVDEHTVREALYAAMFRGESMSDPVLVDAFDDLFGAGFTEKFANHGIRQDNTEITSYMQ